MERLSWYTFGCLLIGPRLTAASLESGRLRLPCVVQNEANVEFALRTDVASVPRLVDDLRVSRRDDGVVPVEAGIAIRKIPAQVSAAAFLAVER